MTGQELKAIRMKLEMDQASFAYLIGTTQKDISRWESGKVKMTDRSTERVLHAINDPDLTIKRAKALIATL